LLEKFSVIHGMSPDASFALSGQIKKLKKPFVSTIHGDPRVGQKVFFRQPLSTWGFKEVGYYVLEFPLHDYGINKILGNSNHTIVCSKSALEDLRSYKSLRLAETSVIYNAVDIQEIECVKCQSYSNDRTLSIVFAGRLFWAKGVMHLLRAFKVLRETNQNVQLRIFGQGPLQKEIKRFVIRSDLETSAKLFGQVSHQRLVNELRNADVVAFPSLQEAQSMFMLEAMSFEKPIVAFDLPFNQELISDNESGLLARPGNIQDLSDKIQLLLSDKNLRSRIGTNAFNHVKTEHNWDKIVNAHINIYENLCSNLTHR
jgi:glycosyltransferase involved in cell wall biosynthesis